MDLLAELNPVQRDAVTHEGGPLLILAGAGSGKTRVLTHRVAYLIRELGVPPDHILAITFTNKAAEEMRCRVECLIGTHLARHVWVSTFHSACVRILRAEAERLGYKRTFTIYDSDDSKKLVELVAKELGTDLKRCTPAMIAGRISWAKSELVDHETFAAGAATPFEKTVAEVYALYTQRLVEANAMDFDDLLMVTVNLLEAFPSVAEAYGDRFQHVLVDEYQDTNHAQYRLIRLLTRGHGNVTVVGDDDQSIYRWRGADIRNILDFEQDFPEATVMRLEQNYRSTGVILECANRVISHNRSRKPKTLWTDNVGGEPVATYLAADEHGEAAFVVSEIERLCRAERRAFRDFAVFYRVHAQSRVFEDVLMRAGVPYRIFGGQKFYERAEIKDILAYLRVAANPDDDVSLKRIVNIPRRGIGETSLARVEVFARREGVPLLEAMRRAECVPGLGSRAVKALSGFVRVMNGVAQQVAEAAPSAAVAAVIDGTGYLDALEAESSVEALSRAENVREFMTVAQEFELLDPEMRLDGFLERISLITDIDRYDASEDAVTLMTLHNAKGLEFPVVFMSGMEEGVFPHHRSLADTDELEEERRLCYVGITRARERVYFTSALSRSMYGATSFNLRSRFMAELPEELMAGPAESGVDGARVAEVAAVGAAAAEAGLAGRTVIGFSVGDVVRHKQFGDGVVTAVKPPDRVTVEFEPVVGTKTLLATYAPLERVAAGR